MDEAKRQQFDRDGFAVIDDFLTDPEIREMKTEISRLAEGEDLTRNRSVFGTGSQQITDDYFLESGDKIRFFLERDAILDGHHGQDKTLLLNKIGHALHWYSPPFRKVTFSERVKRVAKDLNLQRPHVVQSMYILKNPKIGGEVAPHRDGTFLYTDPKLDLVGLWFPLEDATLENGCLWFLPGSQSEPIRRRFVRNPSDAVPKLIFTGPQEESVPDENWVPIEVKRGSCVVIHGQALHKSEPNRSAKPRPAYTFHLIDLASDRTWLGDNWLQPTEELPFKCLYDH